MASLSPEEAYAQFDQVGQIIAGISAQAPQTKVWDAFCLAIHPLIGAEGEMETLASHTFEAKKEYAAPQVAERLQGLVQVLLKSEMPTERLFDFVIHNERLLQAVRLHLEGLRQNEEMEPAELADLDTSLGALSDKWIEALMTQALDRFDHLLELFLPLPSRMVSLLHHPTLGEEVFKFLQTKRENISRFMEAWGGGTIQEFKKETVDEGSITALLANAQRVFPICAELKSRLATLTASLSEAVRQGFFKPEELSSFLEDAHACVEDLSRPDSMGKDNFLRMQRVLERGVKAFSLLDGRVRTQWDEWLKDTSRLFLFEGSEQAQRALQEAQAFLKAPLEISPSLFFTSSQAIDPSIVQRQAQNLNALRATFLLHEKQRAAEAIQWLEQKGHIPSEVAQKWRTEIESIKISTPPSKESFEKAQFEIENVFSCTLQPAFEVMRAPLRSILAGVKSIPEKERGISLDAQGLSALENTLNAPWKIPQDLSSVEQVFESLVSMNSFFQHHKSPAVQIEYAIAYFLSGCQNLFESSKSSPWVASFLTSLSQGVLKAKPSVFPKDPNLLRKQLEALSLALLQVHENFLGVISGLENTSPQDLVEEKAMVQTQLSSSLQALTEASTMPDLLSILGEIRNVLSSFQTKVKECEALNRGKVSKFQQDVQAEFDREFTQITSLLEGIPESEKTAAIIAPFLELKKDIEGVFESSKNLFEVESKLSALQGKVRAQVPSSLSSAQELRSKWDASVLGEYTKVLQAIRNAIKRGAPYVKIDTRGITEIKDIITKLQEYENICISSSQERALEVRRKKLEEISHKLKELKDGVNEAISDIEKARSIAKIRENDKKHSALIGELDELQKMLRERGRAWSGGLNSKKLNDLYQEVVQFRNSLEFEYSDPVPSLQEKRKLLEDNKNKLVILKQNVEQGVAENKREEEAQKMKPKPPVPISEGRPIHRPFFPFPIGTLQEVFGEQAEKVDRFVLTNIDTLLKRLEVEGKTQRIQNNVCLLKVRYRDGKPEAVLKRKMGNGEDAETYYITSVAMDFFAAATPAVAYKKPRQGIPATQGGIIHEAEISDLCRGGRSPEDANIMRFEVVRKCKDPSQVKGLLYSRGIGSLAEFVGRAKLHDAQIVELFAHAANGLAQMHAKGWSHNDIKPENLVVSWRNDKPVVLVSGFDHATKGVGLKMGGALEYLPPEALERKRINLTFQELGLFEGGSYPLSSRDIFALGMSLLESRKGKDANKLRRLHDSDFFAPSPEWVAAYRATVAALDPANHIDNYILRMIDLDPKKRPTAAQVRDEMGKMREAL